MPCWAAYEWPGVAPGDGGDGVVPDDRAFIIPHPEVLDTGLTVTDGVAFRDVPWVVALTTPTLRFLLQEDELSESVAKLARQLSNRFTELILL